MRSARPPTHGESFWGTVPGAAQRDLFAVALPAVAAISPVIIAFAITALIVFAIAALIALAVAIIAIRGIKLFSGGNDFADSAIVIRLYGRGGGRAYSL